jgi:hypothetical protein
MLRQLRPSKRSPVALHRPPLQLRKTHKGDAEEAPGDVAAKLVGAGVAA